MTIVPYDLTWPDRFADERAAILAAGGDRVLTIEHFGGTAVPGLAAQPVIDIAVVVDSVEADGPALAEAVAPLGYRPADAGMRDRLFLQREHDGARTHHLHVVPLAGWDLRNERILRDWLRDHPDDRDRYTALKYDSATRDLDDAGYARAKTDFIQKVVDCARDARGLPRVPVWA